MGGTLNRITVDGEMSTSDMALVFANGLDPAEGPGLIFVTLPIAFGHMPGGAIFGTVFFLLLIVSALTSSIAVLEPVVAWADEKFHVSRKVSTPTTGALAWLVGLACSDRWTWSQWLSWIPAPAGAVKRRNAFCGSSSPAMRSSPVWSEKSSPPSRDSRRFAKSRSRIERSISAIAESFFSVSSSAARRRALSAWTWAALSAAPASMKNLRSVK